MIKSIKRCSIDLLSQNPPPEFQLEDWDSQREQPTKYTKKHEKSIRLIFYILALDNDQNLQEYLFKKTTTHSFINIKTSVYLNVA